MPYSMQQTQPQQPKAAQRQQHAVFKNTYRRDSVLSNEKDEPKMTKARCTLRRRCRYLQCVRDGEGGAAVAAPIKQETKTKIKIKQKRMKHALLNATNATSAAESNSTTTTRCIQKHSLLRTSTSK